MIRCKELPTDLKDGEEIKDITGYEGRYAVSNYGRIWSYPKQGRKGKWKNVYLRKSGYAVVQIANKSYEKRLFLVHRLVAMMFIPNPQNKPCVNHKDFNRANNRIDNLEWCTEHENVLWSRKSDRWHETIEAKTWERGIKIAQQKAKEKKTYLIAHKATKEKQSWRKMVEKAKELKTWEKAHIAAWKVLKKKTKLFKDGVFVAEFESIKEASQYAADMGWCSYDTLRAFKKSRGCIITSG